MSPPTTARLPCDGSGAGQRPALLISSVSAGPRMSRIDMERITRLVYSHTGIALRPELKEAMVIARLQKRLREGGFAHLYRVPAVRRGRSHRQGNAVVAGGAYDEPYRVLSRASALRSSVDCRDAAAGRGRGDATDSRLERGVCDRRRDRIRSRSRCSNDSRLRITIAFA